MACIRIRSSCYRSSQRRRDKAHSFRRSFGAHAFISTLTSSAASTCISRRRPAWRRVALKGDRLRPLRSAQAVAVHQDGIGGRGHPVERCRFFPDQAKFGAVRRRHGLRPRRSGPRRFDAGRRAVRMLRGRTAPSRALGGIKGRHQIDRVRVLEVRIHSPPAVSPRLARFCPPTAKSRLFARVCVARRPS